MKSAIGNSLLMSLVIVIVSVIMILFVSVLSYSKAYRIKNKIIELIERNEGYSNDDIELKNEINEYLRKSGYKVGKNQNCIEAFEKKGIDVDTVYSSEDYNYCIGEKKVGEEVNKDGTKKYNGKYYSILTYVEFNFPIVGSINPISISGETRILGKDYYKFN